MQSGEWKNRASDNQLQVQQLTEWVGKEVITIEQQTSDLTRARTKVKEQIQQLKRKIEEEGQPENSKKYCPLQLEIEELRSKKKQNSKQIQTLRQQIDKKRSKCKEKRSLTIANKQLSINFDAKMKKYLKLNQIQVLLDKKSKIASEVLMAMESSPNRL